MRKGMPEGIIVHGGEVFIKRYGDLTYIGCTSDSGYERSIDTNDLRCGKDGALKAIWYSNPDITITIATGNYNPALSKMQNDSEYIYDETIQLPTAKSVTLVPDETTPTDGKYDLTDSGIIIPTTGMPVCVFQDKDGFKYDTTFDEVTMTATVTDGANVSGTLNFMIESATNVILDSDTSSLPDTAEIYIKQAVRNSDNQFIGHYWFYFPKVVGDGNESIANTLSSLTASTATLRALDVDGKLMRQIFVPEV